MNKQLMYETSSESEGEVTGPTTRRAWSDWCSSKGKSSQSEEENNNTNIELPVPPPRKQVGKKRKKLTRTSSSNNNRLIAAQKKKGRVKKGAKPRRSMKIVGLELLHSQTLLSTSAEVTGKKLPAARGCIDQQLTSLTGDMKHNELEIPSAPGETPYALQILLDMFRVQLMDTLDDMKSYSYKSHVNEQIELEKSRNQSLLMRIAQLEKQIKVLIDDSVIHLKERMTELGLNSKSELLDKAKEIVIRHKELQVMASNLQTQVDTIEEEKDKNVNYHVRNLYMQQNGSLNDNMEITPSAAQELVLKEIANTLSHRKKLHAHVTNLENEIILIEKTKIDEQNLVQQTTPITILPIINNNPPIQTTQIVYNHPIVKTNVKTQRKSREHRSRSQEWPDVPDVGKIEENNPEILAQKILETGRQIEAGKLLAGYKNKQTGDHTLMPAPQTLGKNHRNQQQQQQQQIPTTTTKIYNQPAGSPKVAHESPKVVNFEDRLKSIITSVLNEDPDQRKAHPPTPQPQQQQQQQILTKAPISHQPIFNKSTFAATSTNQQQIIPIVTATHHLNATTTISTVSSQFNQNLYKTNSTNKSNKYPSQSYHKSLSINVSPSSGGGGGHHLPHHSPSLNYQNEHQLYRGVDGHKNEFKSPENISRYQGNEICF